MKAKFNVFSLSLICFVIIAVNAWAQTAPQLINYQGRLTDNLGQPLPNGTTIDLTCAFYEEESGGSAYLIVLQEDVVVNGGLFNVLIGSGTITPGTEATLSDVFQKHSDVWLGIEVNEDGEMTPRNRIGSVPYATKADDGVPKGLISMWSGTLNTIPTGWQLCDGTNGTPDLRDRFIFGTSAGQNPGETGGYSLSLLTESNLPSHNHYYTTNGYDGVHDHHVNDKVLENTNADFWIGGVVPTTLTYAETQTSRSNMTAESSHSHSGYTDSTGGGQSFSNIPPYYKLAFIIKI